MAIQGNYIVELGKLLKKDLAFVAIPVFPDGLDGETQWLGEIRNQLDAEDVIETFQTWDLDSVVYLLGCQVRKRVEKEKAKAKRPNPPFGMFHSMACDRNQVHGDDPSVCLCKREI